MWSVVFEVDAERESALKMISGAAAAAAAVNVSCQELI